jgi:hypothetical protein
VSIEDCADGVDNDGDLSIDCLDSDCYYSEDCLLDSEGDCGDGEDADRDGLTDCDDPDCREVCFETDCFDGLDDDVDGLTDCDDPDCLEACTPKQEVDCFDGEDDDVDGLTDCDDPDCLEDCAPEQEVDCFDGLDEDLDGATDCEDEDCFEACAPEQESDCYDGVDEDYDGLIDCEDADCALVCVEVCDSDRDDDQDGYQNCEDEDCWGDALCVNQSIRIVQANYKFAASQHRSSVAYASYYGTTSTTSMGFPVFIQLTTWAKFSDVVGQWRSTSPNFNFTCSWTVSSLELTRTFDRIASPYEPMNWSRNGLEIDSGCPMTAAHLATDFSFYSGALRHRGMGADSTSILLFYGSGYHSRSTTEFNTFMRSGQNYMTSHVRSSGSGTAMSGIPVFF